MLTRQDASAGHPLEAMNKARIPNEFAFKMDTARKIYGSAFVMRMKTEVATLSQVSLRENTATPLRCLSKAHHIDFIA